jgi:hypothetical protein
VARGDTSWQLLQPLGRSNHQAARNAKVDVLFGCDTMIVPPL